MAQLALYKAKGNLANAIIRRWTASPYSHCEIVVNGMGYTSSLRDGGVRSKSIAFTPDNWDVVDLPWVGDKSVLSYFAMTCGDPYGWGDVILAQIFHTKGVQTRASFCSEWCATAMGLPRASSYSPGSLSDIAAYLSKFKA